MSPGAAGTASLHATQKDPDPAGRAQVGQENTPSPLLSNCQCLETTYMQRAPNLRATVLLPMQDEHKRVITVLTSCPPLPSCRPLISLMLTPGTANTCSAAASTSPSTQ